MLTCTAPGPCFRRRGCRRLSGRLRRRRRNRADRPAEPGSEGPRILESLRRPMATTSLPGGSNRASEGQASMPGCPTKRPAPVATGQMNRCAPTKALASASAVSASRLGALRRSAWAFSSGRRTPTHPGPCPGRSAVHLCHGWFARRSFPFGTIRWTDSCRYTMKSHSVAARWCPTISADCTMAVATASRLTPWVIWSVQYATAPGSEARLNSA